LSDEFCLVSGQKNQWGIFTRIAVTASTSKFSKTRCCLLGAKTDQLGPYSLYLVNSRQSLYLGGTALITGPISIAAAGLRADLTGKGYSRESLYDGKPEISGDELPFHFSALVRSNLNWIKGKFSNTDSVVSIEEATNTSIGQSFNKPTLRIQSADSIVLREGELKGNILVYSPEGIYVSGNMKLEDVILVSPKISIAAGFSGNCQILSSNTIYLAKGATLLYPSSILHINEYDSNEGGTAVTLDSLSRFNGSILMLNMPNLSRSSLLSVLSGAEVNGFVYCETRMDLAGKVNGALYIRQFVQSSSSSYRENYLTDGQVAPMKNWKLFAVPKTDNPGAEISIVKWTK
ncbi:MAG: hypothetical protein V4616_09935, partial [Bacteroidota bacterium]